MKTITSFGGPLISLERRFASQWSGVFGKRFVGDTSPFSSDYDAACEATGPRSGRPQNCAVIDNGGCRGFLIAPPAETAIFSNFNPLIIVQIEAADTKFDLGSLDQASFDQVRYPEDRDLEFVTSGGSFVLFDASRDFTEVGSEFLEFEIDRGSYVLSNCEYAQGSVAELNVFRISLSEPNA